MKDAILLSPNDIIGQCCSYVLCEYLNITQKEIQNIHHVGKFNGVLVLNLTTGDSMRYYLKYLEDKFDNRHLFQNEFVVLCREEHHLIFRNIFSDKTVIHDRIKMKNIKSYLTEKPLINVRNELTSQEKKILLLLLKNRTINQISDYYKLNYKTVHTHIRNMAAKLKTKNVKDLYKVIYSI